MRFTVTISYDLEAPGRPPLDLERLVWGGLRYSIPRSGIGDIKVENAELSVVAPLSESVSWRPTIAEEDPLLDDPLLDDEEEEP